MTKRAEESRRYRARNREAIKRRRAEKMADPEFRERQRAQARARTRRYREKGQWTTTSQYAHGADYLQAVAQMLACQGGRCYLCGEGLAFEQAVIDHDHRCCPKGKSCSACRRGLACHRCNLLIGMAEDNPDLLRLIAGNLEIAVKAAEARMASRPTQLTMEPANPTDPEEAGAR